MLNLERELGFGLNTAWRENVLSKSDVGKGVGFGRGKICQEELGEKAIFGNLWQHVFLNPKFLRSSSRNY